MWNVIVHNSGKHAAGNDYWYLYVYSYIFQEQVNYENLWENVIYVFVYGVNHPCDWHGHSLEVNGTKIRLNVFLDVTRIVSEIIVIHTLVQLIVDGQRPK